MKLTILILLISFSSFSNTEKVLDTISVWQVYIGKTLIRDLNDFTNNKRIILKKRDVKVVDTLKIKYFKDTHYTDCHGKIIIKTEKGKIIKEIYGKYNYEIGTVEIQLLSIYNRSVILKYYYKEDENNLEKLLFETKLQ